ncbi:hydrophobic surface binding protein A-domain-containing protein [Aspergillus granulosus]|uniref:Hydrophobic surface binding protein A-domain-containing protein n=1 Tax=Aspergillus granulosus TaxID=176169 RepID=A0ABR4HT34_9EURO
MKFTGLFTLALATAAIATPAKRQSSPDEIIASIAEQVTSLGSAIDGYSGGDTSSIKDASDTLVESINTAVTTVNNGPDLSNSDALALTGPVQDLIDQVEGVISTLNGKSDLVVEAGEVSTVQESLQAQYDAASALAEALSSKVPAALEEIAAELSAGITNAIQVGIDHYAGLSDGGDDEPTSTTTTGSATETSTEEPTSTSTSSTPVIPTPTDEEPTPTGTPTSTPTDDTPAPPDFTGAASKQGFSLVGGALAAVAVAVAI